MSAWDASLPAVPQCPLSLSSRPPNRLPDHEAGTKGPGSGPGRGTSVCLPGTAHSAQGPGQPRASYSRSCLSPACLQFPDWPERAARGLFPPGRRSLSFSKKRLFVSSLTAC